MSETIAFDLEAIFEQILLLDQIKENKTCGTCNTHWGDNMYKVLVRKRKVKRPLDRPTCTFQYNKLQFLNWIQLAQDRFH